MSAHASRSQFHLSRGKKTVIGFYLAFILSIIAWVSVWGLKGTTLVERIGGKLPETILISIFVVPSIACVVFLCLLQGFVNNTSLQLQLPKERDIDERQREVKNGAYHKAYKPVCLLFLVLAAYIAISSTYGLPLPTSSGQGWGIFMFVFLVITSSPLSIIAWRQ